MITNVLKKHQWITVTFLSYYVERELFKNVYCDLHEYRCLLSLTYPVMFALEMCVNNRLL